MRMLQACLKKRGGGNDPNSMNIVNNDWPPCKGLLNVGRKIEKGHTKRFQVSFFFFLRFQVSLTFNYHRSKRRSPPHLRSALEPSRNNYTPRVIFYTRFVRAKRCKHEMHDLNEYCRTSVSARNPCMAGTSEGSWDRGDFSCFFTEGPRSHQY